VLAKATVLLAIATALLAGIAAGQAWILATTDASTRKAADAAVTSAQTAQAALKTAQENFRKEQRPIVWLNDLGTPTFIPNRKTADGTGQIVWSWHFTNYGRSPALHLSFDHFMRIENATEGVTVLLDHPQPRRFQLTKITLPRSCPDRASVSTNLIDYLGQMRLSVWPEK
jgi:hypothetical protein